MDRVEPECHRNSLRGTGISFRFANRKFDKDQHLGSFENHYSSGGNNEIRSKRLIARKSQSGAGDFTGRSRHPQSWRQAVPSKVVIVYGLENTAVNCDKVFNLFCVYGNVTAVKVMNGKQVLVELQDVEAARRCVSNLNSLRLDEITKLKVTYSKHSSINDHGTSKALSDGTPAKKNYVESKLNRYLEKETEDAIQLRTAAPSKVLRFYNAPLNICATQLSRVVTKALGCTDAIRWITIMPRNLPGTKCSAGLIEFKNIELAAKTIFVLNHLPFESSRSPFLMKLCFSKSLAVRQQSTGSSRPLLNTSRVPRPLPGSESHEPAVELPVSRASLKMTGPVGTLRASWRAKGVAAKTIDRTAELPVSRAALQTTGPAGTSRASWRTSGVAAKAIDRAAGHLVRSTDASRNDWRVKRGARP